MPNETNNLHFIVTWNLVMISITRVFKYINFHFWCIYIYVFPFSLFRWVFCLFVCFCFLFFDLVWFFLIMNFKLNGKIYMELSSYYNFTSNGLPWRFLDLRQLKHNPAGKSSKINSFNRSNIVFKKRKTH